jgi:hypothetical protein
MKKQNTNRTAAKILEDRGWLIFDLKQDSANGPDLTIARNGKSYRVEVKTIIRGKKCCGVTPIGKSGLKCDAIAILFEDNKTLILQPMTEHLKLVGGGGARGMTLFVDLNS